MRINLSYLFTIFLAVLLLYFGHRFAVEGRFSFYDNSQEHARATVQRIIERIQAEDFLDFFDDDARYSDTGDNAGSGDEFLEYDDFFMALIGEKIIFEAEINSGRRKGQLIRAEQSLSDYSMITPKEVAEGDSILLINTNIGWFYNGHVHTNGLFALGIIFAICILIFGRTKGFNTILSLGFTVGSVFYVFIPAILAGKNIYLMSSLVCFYTTVITLLLVIGYSKKSLAAAIGCISGILTAGIITIIMDRVLQLTGVVDEYSRHLINLPLRTAIDLKAIIFAGITIGAMGAIMDVAMSIASSMWEIKEEAKSIKFNALFRSGLNIGRDIMGTMANTLILAYIGSSLSVVLVLSVYSNSLMELLNREMIMVEILQALAGSFGILFAMPLTAFFCSVFYLKKSN